MHGEVGIVPVPIHAQPLQLFALHIHPVLGIGATFRPELDRIDLILVQLLLAVLFLNLPFDRQAVAVPTRNVRRIFAQQALRTDHHVLQDVVQRMANVHVAIGVGRAIVKDELFAPSARFAQATIQVLLLPTRQNTGLLLGEAGLHREVSLR